MNPIKTLKQTTYMVQEIKENVPTGNTNRAYSSIQVRSLSASLTATAKTLDLEINCQDKIWKSNMQILDAVVCNRLGDGGLWDRKRYGREQSWPCLMYCLQFCLESLRKTTGNSQNGRNSNWAASKYKSEALSLETACSVM